MIGRSLSESFSMANRPRSATRKSIAGKLLGKVRGISPDGAQLLDEELLRYPADHW
jgi:hypothetical protein